MAYWVQAVHESGTRNLGDTMQTWKKTDREVLEMLTLLQIRRPGATTALVIARLEAKGV